MQFFSEKNENYIVNFILSNYIVNLCMLTLFAMPNISKRKYYFKVIHIYI